MRGQLAAAGLGQVSEGRTGFLGGRDLGEIENALDDAIGYREPDNGTCPGCTPEGLCGDHQADQDAADSYRALKARVQELLYPELEAS